MDKVYLVVETECGAGCIESIYGIFSDRTKAEYIKEKKEIKCVYKEDIEIIELEINAVYSESKKDLPIKVSFDDFKKGMA